jgi:DNA-binding transcriptional LysR family regulator
MQDYNDMAYFAEVVDKGGFAAAGRSLAVPKSRLSRRIAELESRLGARLLQRTTRKLSLTVVGERVYRHCVAMREQAQAVDEVVALSHTAPCGTIRIACPVTLAQTLISPVVSQFLARYPLVKIDMQVINRVVDLIEDGFDLALRVRPTLDDSGSMVIKNFGPTSTLLVSSPAQMARQGAATSPQDLHRMDSVAMSAANGISIWRLQGPDGQAFTLEHQPRLVADDLLVLLQAARDGVGIAVIPDYMCREGLANGELVQVLPGWAPPLMIMHAAFPSRRGLVPAVRQFLDFLGEHLRSPDGDAMPAVRPAAAAAP